MEVYSIQGFLWKAKKTVTGGLSWKKNWVYADQEVLLQYGGNNRPTTSETPKYTWKLADCTIQPNNARKYSFEIISLDNSSVIFTADDADSYSKWLKILTGKGSNQQSTPEEDEEEAEGTVDDKSSQRKSVKGFEDLEEMMKPSSDPMESLIREYYRKQLFKKVHTLISSFLSFFTLLLFLCISPFFISLFDRFLSVDLDESHRSS
jgi:hypothetical protein